MKNAVSLSLWITLFVACCTGCNSNKNLITQNSSLNTLNQFKVGEKINGSQLIEAMLAQRFQFNKILIKNGFNPKMPYPKVVSVMNSASVVTISFNGLDYSVIENKIAGIKGITLSPLALSSLSDKMTKLDLIQQYYGEQSNLAYGLKKRDLQMIKELDRRYFAALKSIRQITLHISELARKPHPAISIEISIAKIKLPDNKIEFKKNYVAEAE
jgi:hypothetical protein